jgi:CRP-like cAMP-binding protein
MKKIHFVNLSEKAIKCLKKIATFKRYSEDSPLHYQGQIPIVAYLIVKGNILLLKNSEIYHKLTKGYIIGYRELCLNAPSMFTAEVLGNTELCYIDKSTLLEIKNSKNTEIHLLYLELKNAIK